MNLLNKIEKNNNTNLNNILSKTYIQIFIEVFYRNEKEIIYEGLKLNLPIKFDDFLKKVAKEDYYYRQRIRSVIKKNFFPKKIFIVKN